MGLYGIYIELLN